MKMSRRKPSKSVLSEFKVDYEYDNVFTSKVRLLQSIWRNQQGWNYDTWGNFLPEKEAKESACNFLTPNIQGIIRSEMSNLKKTGKLIQAPRIWNNLMSSQPLAFKYSSKSNHIVHAADFRSRLRCENPCVARLCAVFTPCLPQKSTRLYLYITFDQVLNLFGELSLDMTLATAVFQEIFPGREIKNITHIEFEYSPGRGNDKYTGDSSAFDVFVAYRNMKDEKGFVGIEVKYTEKLYDEPSSHKSRYEEIAELSAIFDMSFLPQLKDKPIQQIWRDHLLALSMFKANEDYAIGDFVFLYPSGNRNCKNAIVKYEQTLSPEGETYFLPAVMEDWVKVIKNHTKEQWILDFEHRYLNFEKLKDY